MYQSIKIYTSGVTSFPQVERYSRVLVLVPANGLNPLKVNYTKHGRAQGMLFIILSVAFGSMASLSQHNCLNGHLPFLSVSFRSRPSLSFHIFYFLPPNAFLPLPQPSTWPISVCLLSCTILCVLAFC